ncbi:arylsulfotransferase family protein [Salinibacter altiplanensis]|uniref:arylsulfotransferase family protein n=1 Tax=Salinibacter altiplanensis TaxID=1803181 RepID=UPI000C9EFFF4|nr:arylsulfotransferase family protein [Salinibacter altiplanensis]
MRAASKIWFVVSVALLAFLVGFAIRATRVPPNDFLKQAWMQARSTVEPPTFLKPRVHDRSGVRLKQPDAMQDGTTLLTSTWKGPEGWSPRIRLINRTGDVLHEWRVDETALFADSLAVGRKHYLHGSHLLPNGDVLFNVEHGGTARADACGDVKWRLPIGTHHSIDRAADGSFWISDITQSPRQTDRAVPGEAPGLKTAYLDRLTRISADGQVLRTINVLEVLYANDLARYISKSFIGGQVEDSAARLPGTDPTHLNDVEPLSPSMADAYPLFEAGDLLVSLRNVHLVFVLDPETETVKWHASDPFIMQHDPDFIGDGWIGVFDNNRDLTTRGTMQGGSRVWAIQPHTDSIEVLFPTPKSDAFYTEAGGKWQMLSNGNLLLTESHTGRIVEAAPDGRTVWEWTHPSHNESMVPAVQEGTRYDLSPNEINDWPCSSEDFVRTPTPE